MPNQPKIEVQISAKADQLSASLAKVRKEIAGLPALAEQASRKFGGTDLFGGGRGNASMFGLDRIHRQIGRVYGSARIGASGLTGGLGLATRTIPGLGLVAGAASAAGIGEMVNSLAGAGVELTNTARLAGTTAAGLNSMRGAARLMGLSAGTADAAMTGLNHTIQDAVYGKNADALNYFKLAGIDIGSIATGAKSAESVLPKVVESLTKAAKTNPLAAEQLAQIWGVPSAALPMLIRGQEALQANRLEVERIYGSFDKYQESSERFTFATGRLSLASEKLGMTVMTSLEPHLTPLLLNLSNWVQKHEHDIGDTFEHIGKAVEGVHWADVGAGIDKVGKAISTAAGYADDFGTRLDRALRTINEITHGRTPTDSGIGIPAGSPAYNRVMESQQPGLRQETEGLEGWAPRSAPQGSIPTYDTTLNPHARGLLDTIAGTESPGYNVLYGGGRFSDMSHHPNVPVPITSGPNAGMTSTAAGRYQFLNGTWQQAAAALGLKDFSPGSQDRAAWWLAQRDYNLRTGRQLADDIKSSDPKIKAGIGRALHGTWTSLPGGIEAGTTEEKFARQLEANTKREMSRMTPGGTDIPVPTGSPLLLDPRLGRVAPDTGSNNGQSTVRIEIDHRNVPAGVTMSPSVQGNGAELGGIRVRRAMPEAGMAPTFGGT